jgi:hypothetical protein
VGNHNRQWWRHEKAPHLARLSHGLVYRLRPEPGPVGVSVEPLGEAPAPTVLPDGFMVFGPPGVVPAAPVLLLVPAALPVVPLMEEPGLLVPPVVAPPVAPEEEPAPAEPPLLCASANVLESARAVASAIVEIFMVAFLSAMSMNKSRRGFMFHNAAACECTAVGNRSCSGYQRCTNMKTK